MEPAGNLELALGAALQCDCGQGPDWKWPLRPAASGRGGRGYALHRRCAESDLAEQSGLRYCDTAKAGAIRRSGVQRVARAIWTVAGRGVAQAVHRARAAT